YFRIRKAIDRRLYEIARKHCAHQGEFTIALEKLHLKTGSTALYHQHVRRFSLEGKSHHRGLKKTLSALL
uniref:replication initiator protein A n=1 Tax=Candidatus Williamhamiltonella defendens TaxID=138072 RepID=UPI001583636F